MNSLSKKTKDKRQKHPQSPNTSIFVHQHSGTLTHIMPNSPSRIQNGSSKKGSTDSLSNGIPSTEGRNGSLSSSPLINHNVVFLFIPNIIGYTRVVLAAASLYFMRWHPKYCTWLYIVSCLLDAFDGMAARRFGQSIISFYNDWSFPQQANLELFSTWWPIVALPLVFSAFCARRILRTLSISRQSFLWTLLPTICICTGISIDIIFNTLFLG